MSYLTSAKKNVHLFVETCVAAGLKHIVISPGSRNAPLTISFDEHPEVKTTLVHDERSAGFFALGIALQLQEPVAVLCTSGSAVLNYFPAVAEAYYQNIPLIVISADRPQEWINHGDGQTIMQDNVFGTHMHSFIQLEDKYETEHYYQFLCMETLDIINKAKGEWSGPVHINFALEEPLYNTVEVSDFHAAQAKCLSYADQTKSNIENSTTIDWALFQNQWSAAKKKIVLCGQMPKKRALLDQLKTMSEDPTVLIMVENTSNLYDLKFVHCIDRTIEHLDRNNSDFIPEILVTLGGAIVSKKIKNLFRDWNIQHHWRVGYAFPEMDTFRHLSESVECAPTNFIRKLNEAPRNTVELYASKWKSIDFIRQEKTTKFCKSAPFSDLKVFSILNDYLPEMSVVHLGNSSVVRYAQLFDPIASITYQSNRGTSGIDGSMSTATGAAFADKDSWHVHVTGDISFFYDSNALWNKFLTPNLRIFLINNEGGGIFKIIPGPNSTQQYKKYFVAEHQHSAEHICKAFEMEYFSARNTEELHGHMEAFYQHEADGRPKLMEIFTDTELNPEVLHSYFTALK
ncbi:MAG: 2-succinyl-5-enolpyruvyl-6-hydroxy-3-cyclohexene-1-carboxylic-acid synthase [Flavobacteriales bacterium]